MRLRPEVGALLSCVLLAACSGSATGGAQGSCVGPYLDERPRDSVPLVSTPSHAPGDEITVNGHWYRASCDDTGPDFDAPVPLGPVRLTLVLPDGARQDLGSFSPAGDDLGFSATVRLPADARSGVARVVDDGVYPATHSFVIIGP